MGDQEEGRGETDCPAHGEGNKRRRRLLTPSGGRSLLLDDIGSDGDRTEPVVDGPSPPRRGRPRLEEYQYAQPQGRRRRLSTELPRNMPPSTRAADRSTSSYTSREISSTHGMKPYEPRRVAANPATSSDDIHPTRQTSPSSRTPYHAFTQHDFPPRYSTHRSRSESLKAPNLPFNEGYPTSRQDPLHSRSSTMEDNHQGSRVGIDGVKPHSDVSSRNHIRDTTHSSTSTIAGPSRVSSFFSRPSAMSPPPRRRPSENDRHEGDVISSGNNYPTIPGPPPWNQSSRVPSPPLPLPRSPQAWFTPGTPHSLSDLRALSPDMVEMYQMGWEDAMRSVEAGVMGVDNQQFGHPQLVHQDSGRGLPGTPRSLSSRHPSLLQPHTSLPRASSYNDGPLTGPARIPYYPPPRPHSDPHQRSYPAPYPSPSNYDYFRHHPANPHPPPSSYYGYGRSQRQLISCYPCRARKLKCDGQKPCQQCLRRGSQADCAYADSVKRRGKGRKGEDGRSSDGEDGSMSEIISPVANDEGRLSASDGHVDGDGQRDVEDGDGQIDIEDGHGAQIPDDEDADKRGLIVDGEVRRDMSEGEDEQWSDL